MSQTDTVHLVRIKNYFPGIGGIQKGEIPFWQLCHSEGITTSQPCTIFSFDLEYYGKVGVTKKHIAGNKIPQSICTEIGQYGLNNMLFFTNIKAIDPETYRVLYISPMNLIPTRK